MEPYFLDISFPGDISMNFWSIISEHVIELFAEKLDSHKDFLSFGAVCTSWRSVFKNNLRRLPFKIAISHCLPKGKPLPVLLLYSSEMDGKRHRLFNLLCNEKMAEVSHELILSETVNKWIMGSWRGWLLVANYFSGKRMALINPLTGEEVCLPSFSSLAMHLVYMNNVACSSCPPAPGNKNKNNNCVYMVMFACNYSSICCCRVGDDKWNIYRHPHGIVNLVNHNGIFYAIDTRSDLYKITMMEQEHTIDVQHVLAWHQAFHQNQGLLSKNFIVESSGELLLVTRAMVDELLDGIPDTQIFKLTSKYIKHFGANFLTKYEWQNIEDIGNRIIFVGHKDSISVESSLYPARLNKGNCIYFTHVIDHNLHTVVFNLTTRSVEYISLHHVHANLEALWFSPNPW